jgi:hypothetical protein
MLFPQGRYVRFRWADYLFQSPCFERSPAPLDRFKRLILPALLAGPRTHDSEFLIRASSEPFFCSATLRPKNWRGDVVILCRRI